MTSALHQFAQTLHEKFSSHVTGEPEEQLRAPFEQLLAAAGRELGFANVLPIGETLLTNIGRPDYGVALNTLLCGHVELKAPGKGADTAKLKGHDRAQWERFKNLPNILYSDGQAFALYRLGKLVRSFSLPQNPCAVGAAAVEAESLRQFGVLLTDFLNWEPIVPGNARQLVEYLAPLCRNLRDDVLDALKKDIPAVRSTANDWRRYLFPGADDAHFADAYAQTVTFSLLLARSNGSDTLFLDKAIASLTHASSLLSRALQVLTDPLVNAHLGASLEVLMRVISRVPSGTMSGGRRDPWLNFYEDFLAEYDPKLRRDAGAYYTPVEVVKAQVCLVDDILKTRLGKSLGFAAGGVNVLDPAVGTGTYLLGIIEHAMETVRQKEGDGALPARSSLLGSNLYGFEIMVGPYAVASLRLTRMVQQYGGELPEDGVQIMLNNTLESPHENIPELPLFYQPIGVEHKRARRVKETVPVLVCIGNPPYDRHAAVSKETLALTGGWVRWGEAKDGRNAIMADFIDPVKQAGKGGSLKNLYNLYVYFWRFALWKTFEHDLAIDRPGVVSFITASSFMEGDAFLGMRQHMRRVCDEIWVIDLGGEGRGTRQDDNVFAIQTPVAITLAVRYGKSQPETPAKVHYTRMEGSRAEKLAKLERLHSLADLNFMECGGLPPLSKSGSKLPHSISEWNAPFRPAGKGDYFDWPLLTDLMPWQQSGVKCGRTWVISANRKTLTNRFQQLANSSAADRATLFKDSPTGKKINDKIGTLIPAATEKTRIADLTADTLLPNICLY
ncbi:MAG: N-6 DNA methylase, partial [Zoogloeaceae bacterium]|nr:N-6 DNA methylase [Zoogloeaceae bacterium]